MRVNDEMGKTKEEWEGRRGSRWQEMVKWRRIEGMGEKNRVTMRGNGEMGKSKEE